MIVPSGRLTMRNLARPAQTATVVAVLASHSSPVSAQQPARPSWAPAVESALGRPGTMQPGDVLKFGFPRSDLSVTLGGVTLRPALALGGWPRFKEAVSGQALALGELVLPAAGVSARR